MQHYHITENRIVYSNGHEFLFLVEENAIFELDADTRRIIRRSAGRGEFPRERFIDGLEGSEAEKNEVFDNLVKCHVIAPAGRQPAFSGEAEAHTGTIPLKTLVLFVTERCNLGCLYCYHGQGKHPLEGGGSMSPAVARQAVDFLFDHSGDLEEVVLVFFGGEPLLNFNLICQAVAYGHEKASETGKRITFSLTTNATVLNPEIIRFILDNRISLTISLDGFAEIHDRYRRFPDGSPSYPVILPRIKQLFQEPVGLPVVARVTVCRTPRSVPRILEHLLDLGFAEVGFAPVTSEDPQYQLDTDGMDQLLNCFKDLSEKFLAASEEDAFYGFTNLIDLLVVLHEGEIKNYPCGAGLGLFSVDPTGGLYLCQRLTGLDDWCMGDIFSGFQDSRLHAFRKAAQIGPRETCRHCWARMICAGGCYHEALVREGNLFKPNHHYCEWIKRWIETGLGVYGMISLNNSEYLEKLSVIRGRSTIFNHFT